MREVSSKCTLFVLEAARRGDEAHPTESGAGWVGHGDLKDKEGNTFNQQQKLQKKLVHQCNLWYNGTEQRNRCERERGIDNV